MKNRLSMDHTFDHGSNTMAYSGDSISHDIPFESQEIKNREKRRIWRKNNIIKINRQCCKILYLKSIDNEMQHIPVTSECFLARYARSIRVSNFQSLLTSCSPESRIRHWCRQNSGAESALFFPSPCFARLACVRIYIELQELIKRWDSERELFNDDIAHT